MVANVELAKRGIHPFNRPLSLSKQGVELVETCFIDDLFNVFSGINDLRCASIQSLINDL
jgi:hypothetical protein